MSVYRYWFHFIHPAIVIEFCVFLLHGCSGQCLLKVMLTCMGDNIQMHYYVVGFSIIPNGYSIKLTGHDNWIS